MGLTDCASCLPQQFVVHRIPRKRRAKKNAFRIAFVENPCHLSEQVLSLIRYRTPLDAIAKMKRRDWPRVLYQQLIEAQHWGRSYLAYPCLLFYQGLHNSLGSLTLRYMIIDETFRLSSGGRVNSPPPSPALNFTDRPL